MTRLETEGDAVSARLCSTCGAELDSGAMFCAECGARVTAVPPSPVVPYPHAAAPYTPLPPVPSSGPVAPAPGPYATTQPAPGPHAAPVGPALPGSGVATSAPTPAVPPPAPPSAVPSSAVPSGGLPTSAVPTSAVPAPMTAAPPSAAPMAAVPTSSAPSGAPSDPGARSTSSRGAAAFPVVPGSVAPVGRRVAAFAIDGAALMVLGGVGVAIMLATTGEPEVSPTSVAGSFVPSALVGVGGLALWVSEAVTGATLGGALLGIRTVSAQTGRPAGLLRILLRQLVVGLGVLACFIGEWLVVSSGVFDKSPAQRGWHDKAAGTIVLLASATGVARAQDPSHAWDQAVARAVGPVPPPPPSAPAAPSAAPATASVAPPAPPVVPPAPITAAPPVPVASVPPAPSGPVTGAAAGDDGSGAWVRPAPPAPPAPSSSTTSPAAAYEAPATIGLVPLPPGVGLGRPSQPDAGPLITGAPGASGDVASVSSAALTTGRSQPLAGDTLSARTLGDTPPAGGERVTEPVGPAASAGSASGSPDAAPPATDRRSAPEPGVTAAPDAAPLPRWAVEELDEIELTRLRTPATGTEPVPQGLRLAFDTGERVDVVGDGVVGRAPQGGVAHVVAIDDPARSLSKTHLAFGLAGPGELWVADRGSTNGTVVVRPDGAAATLPAGMRGVVTVGWSLRLGERTVRVEAR